MDLASFKRTLTSFTDDHADLDLAKGQLIVQIRDELIEATVTEQEGDVFVDEHDGKVRAYEWLINRVARLPQLAARIVNHVVSEPHFITPAGKVLDHLEDESHEERQVEDVPSEVIRLLGKRPAGSSAVLYVTSDAGEGKTTVIDQVARDQAIKYRSGTAKWLLLPIRLGGRSFLNFDDVVVAELVNRFRFQLFYYDAFLELVRLGVIIPAFDGFEEIFVESSTGEGVSSLGNLVRSLNSSGSVVIAVRKAHFEYHSFRAQARVYDALSDIDASFARISIERWNRERFLEYCGHRQVSPAKEIYEAVRDKLQAEDHPVLTRAVLAKRLVDVAEKNDLNALLEKLGTAVSDYFYHFVNAIVEREVYEKWIDRSGTPHQALLTVDEHHELLRMIAKEMWITSSDILSADYIHLVAELFAEEFSKPAPIARQISNRLGQHSLMVINRTSPVSYAFDHDDFRMFYWGEAIARMIVDEEDVNVLRIFLDRRRMPEVASDSAVAAMRRDGADLHTVIGNLGRVALGDAGASYVAENVGGLAIRLLDVLIDGGGIELNGFHFPAEAIRGRAFTGVSFRGCSFAATSLDSAVLTKVIFAECDFDEITIGGAVNAVDVAFRECFIACVRIQDAAIYDPSLILRTLEGVGMSVDRQYEPQAAEVEVDALTELAERALRIFLRATAVNESALERRLGVKWQLFLTEVLPLMLERGVLKEVEFAGRGRRQRRFKIAVSMRGIEGASVGAGLSLRDFVERLRGA